MKKYVVLFFLVILLGGCYFMTPPAIRVDNAIEKAGQQYQILKDVSIAIVGNRAETIGEVFHDFGFSVVENEADYMVRVEVENLGWGQSWGYQMYPAKIRMRVKNNRTGREYFYKADGTFSYHLNYGYSGYNGTIHYPDDPYGLAAKIAAKEAIRDFIEEQGIPHRWPKKE